MEMRILVQGVNDPPRLGDLPTPVVDLTTNETITFCVVEKGMQSGEPSVIIVSSSENFGAIGSICLQTSLDKFLSGASMMAAQAEEHWGWTRPEGHATIMPPDKATRKMLLEKIKEELEEWDEVDP